jgi:hypothetical protein
MMHGQPQIRFITTSFQGGPLPVDLGKLFNIKVNPVIKEYKVTEDFKIECT